MKKRTNKPEFPALKTLALLGLAVLALCLTACPNVSNSDDKPNQQPEPEPDWVTISFVTNSNSTSWEHFVVRQPSRGELNAFWSYFDYRKYPENNPNDNYSDFGLIFMGWYLDADLTQPAEFIDINNIDDLSPEEKSFIESFLYPEEPNYYRFFRPENDTTFYGRWDYDADFRFKVGFGNVRDFNYSQTSDWLDTVSFLDEYEYSVYEFQLVPPGERVFEPVPFLSPWYPYFHFAGWYLREVEWIEGELNSKYTPWNFSLDTVPPIPIITDLATQRSDICIVAMWRQEAPVRFSDWRPRPGQSYTFFNTDKIETDVWVIQGEKVPQPESVTIDGSYFLGWYTGWTYDYDNGNIIIPSGKRWDFENDIFDLNEYGTLNLTLYGIWGDLPLGNWSVGFNANQGYPAPADLYVEYNSLVPEPEPMTRTGHTFDGWYTEPEFTNQWDFDTEPLTESITLHAKWDAHTYTIIYDKNHVDATGEMTPSEHTYDFNKNLNYNEFVRTGYNFNGWSLQPDGSGTVYANGQNALNLTDEPNGEVTLYARWSVVSYSITYDKNALNATGTTYNSTHNWYAGKALNTNAYSYTGYTFISWNTLPDGTGQGFANNEIVSNLTLEPTLTLYAQWCPNAYTIVYDRTTGTGTQMPNSSHTYNEPKALNANTYTKAGYIFGEWASSAGGASPRYSDGQEVVNLSAQNGATVTLYAYWVSRCTVTFDSRNGSANTTQTVDPGEKIEDPGIPTRPGWTFIGWCRFQSNPDSKWDFDNDTLNSNITLYAVYEWGTDWPIKQLDYLQSYIKWGPQSWDEELERTCIYLAAILNDPSVPNRISWKALLNSTTAEGKYVNLDISQSYGSSDPDGGLNNSGVFDLMNAYSIDPHDLRIAKLTLPTQATTLANTNYTLFTLLSCRIIEGENIIVIGNNALRSALDLRSAIFPNVTQIGDDAFNFCYFLPSVDFPNVTQIGDRSFYNCYRASSIQLPNVTKIGDEAFRGCTILRTVNFPKATQVGAYAFRECSELESASFGGNYTSPNLTIGNSAFYGCTNLESLYIYNVTSIGTGAFASTGGKKLDILMGPIAPKLGISLFSGITSQTKSITVFVDESSTPSGYGTIPSHETSPYTGWRLGFRGMGWDGTKILDGTENKLIYLAIW